MKALKHCIDKLKRVISMILDWFMEVIMSVKQENEAIINRKYDFYEFVLSMLRDEVSNLRDMSTSRALCLAIGIGLGTGFVTFAIFKGNDNTPQIKEC